MKEHCDDTDDTQRQCITCEHLSECRYMPSVIEHVVVGAQPRGLVRTENQGDLDLGEVQEVLGDVDGDLVKEGRGDVEAVLDVVQVALCLGQVLL